MKPRLFLVRRSFQACALILSLVLIGVPASSSQAAGPGQQETTPGGPAPESPAGSPAEAGSIFEVSCGDSAGLVTAIVTANTNAGADTVVLNPDPEPVCTYTFSTGYGGGPNALPALGDTLTIEGNGATIERSTTGGPPNFRIFEVGAGAIVTINGLTIRNGSIRGTNGTSGTQGATGSEGAPGGYPGGTGSGGGTGSSGGAGGAGGSGQGGAIYVAGSGRLTLHLCVVTGNRAAGGTGGAGGPGGSGGAGGRGGDGRDAQCDFFGCGVPATNGGIGGKGGDGGTGGFGGAGGQAQGGGIYNAGILSLEGTTVSGNAVTGGAGGAGGRGGTGVLGAVGGQGGDAACYGLWSTAAGNGGMGGGGGTGGNGGAGRRGRPGQRGRHLQRRDADDGKRDDHRQP